MYYFDFVYFSKDFFGYGCVVVCVILVGFDRGFVFFRRVCIFLRRVY